MYDANITLRQGEIRPIYGQAIAASGDTVTIQAAPSAPYTAPAFTLFDSAGVPVSGWNNISIGAASYQAGAQAAPLIWAMLNTSGLNAGAYVARFVFAVRSAQDGLTRELACEVQISLLPPVTLAATYDPTTASGQTRLYCLDNDIARAIFSDIEIGQFLQDAGGVPLLAASLALDALATDRARVATILKIGTYGLSEAGIYTALAERAATLRRLALVTPIVVSPAAVFPGASDGLW